MKNRGIFIALISIAAILYIFSGSGKKTVRPRNLNKDQYEQMLSWVNENRAEPEEYVLDLFQEKDIVFLGANEIFADGINFVGELVPDLYKNGIETVAVDFLLARDQELIDQLLTDSMFDAVLAKKLLFNRFVIFGYQEYVDMLETVWELNDSLHEGKNSFRVLGLSPYQDFSGIENEKDFEDNSKKLNIVADYNTVDSFMGKKAVELLAESGKKSLVFTALEHSFTAFKQYGFENTAAEIGYPSENRLRMGNYVYEKIGDRAVTVFIHTYLPDRTSPVGLNYPLGGIMEKVARGLDNINKRFGFTVKDSPFAGLDILGEFVRDNPDKAVLEDFTCGYIFLNPVKNAETVSTIPHFINAENLEEARKNFPGSKNKDYDANSLNSFISGNVSYYVDLRKYFI